MTLEQLIEDHRAAFRNDLWIERLVSRQPTTYFDVNAGQYAPIEGTQVGMPMSPRLLKYVSHPEGYGSDFPWSKALYRVRWWCRKNHPYHRASDRPYWRGSLCHQFVSFVVVRDFSILSAAQVLRYDNPEPVLRAALQYIEDTMDDYRDKAEKRAREDEGRGDGAIPVERPAHHVPSEQHVAECPNPVCRARRAA